MANLNTKTIGDGVGDILAVDGGVTGSGKNVKDGAGNVTPLWLTTTKLGIGTDSPQQDLHIQSSGPQIRISDGDSTNTTNATATIEFYDRNNTARLGYMGAGSGVNENMMFTNSTAGGDIAFHTADHATAKMTIDGASGNVGIGTTSPDFALEVEDGAVGESTYVNINNKNTNQFLKLGVKADVAEIAWDNGDKLQLGVLDDSTDTTITPYMTILSTGNVGIGTSAPGYGLDISGAGVLGQLRVYSTDADGTIRIDTADEDHSSTLSFESGGASKGIIYYDHHATAGSQTMNFKVGDNGVHAMTILGDGNVGIGTTTPGETFHIKANDSGGFAAYFHNDGDHLDRSGIKIACGQDSPTGAGNCDYINFLDGNGSGRGGIRCGSTPNNPEFYNGSDARMKKDIAPTTVKGLDTINALKLSKWNWNHPSIAIPKQDIGIVADDLESVLPELISTGKIAGWDDIATDLKQVPSETKLTFILMKAVQELSAKVTALENA